MLWRSTKAKRVPDTALPASFVVLVLAFVSVGGCCSENDETSCFDWDESATCPSPEVAAARLVSGSDTVNSSGTFWPAHDYLINGVPATEPSVCCYEVTRTHCFEWDFR